MNCSDGGDTGVSFIDYDELFSVLLYYGMSKQDILQSSRAFLYAIYRKYINRAYENLGTSPEADDEETESESEYPSQFKKFTKQEREEALKKDERTDEEFLSMFPSFSNH